MMQHTNKSPGGFMTHRPLVAFAFIAFTCLNANAAPMSNDAAHTLAHDIFKQLIEIKLEF